jgi:hypothetical protein
VTVDASSNVWVTEDHRNAILEYASTDKGCPTPRSFIRGSATGLADPTGIAVDSTGRIIVDDASTGAVEVFAVGAHGNVAPVQVITGLRRCSTARKALPSTRTTISGSLPAGRNARRAC